jgi:DNA-binding MarR family transcriptional regulator
MSQVRTKSTVILPPMALDEHFNPKVPGIDYGVLDELLGYAIRRTQIVVYEDFIASLAPWNITPPRYSSLVIIERNPNLKLTELANVLGIARSGAVALIDSLEEFGYVLRVPSPTDKRALGLVLTDKGRADLADITKAVVAHDQRMAQRLDPTEQAQLLNLLGKVGGFVQP